MRITMFKLPSHRVFNHTPIYYNETLETQKTREKAAHAELGLTLGDETPDFTHRIKGKIRQRKQQKFESVRKDKRSSNIRLLVIVVALMALAFYFIYSSRSWLELVAQ
jgi:hypothetical protein